MKFYHGTRAGLRPGDTIDPGVAFTPNLDAAIWSAELAPGEGPGRVYVVEPVGVVEETSGTGDSTAPPHLVMSWRSRDPVRVMAEVTDWPLYHGTRADLKRGDLIKPGHNANFGSGPRAANYVYMARTMDAATWGAELAAGEGRPRIYIVEPMGSVEDDPNLTDQKFRGNPTKSFRSKDPLRVVDEVTDWQGHSPAAIEAMKAGLERLRKLGVEPMDD